MTRAPTSRRRRRLVGPLMVVVGVVHVGITPVLFPASVRSIIAAGVVGAVEADPELAQLRGLGFWYATAGLGVVLAGWSVGVLERRGGPLPAALPLLLAGIGVWGVLLMPRSPFWVFVALAVLAAVRRTQDRRPAEPLPGSSGAGG